MSIPRKKKRSSPLLTRILMWSVPILAVVLIAAYVGFRLWFNAYLKSDAFRGLIGGITARQLKATGEYEPFNFADSDIYSDGFKAHGTWGAAFSELGADQIRAHINLGGLWNHAWEIDEISIQRLQVSLGHEGTEPANSQEVVSPDSYAMPSLPKFKWLPDHVDLRKVLIDETNLKWGENTPQAGSIKNMRVTITPDGPGNEAWKIFCESGTISEPGAPGLTITEADLRYQRPSLFITDASLRYDSDSTIAFSGEVNFDKGFDVLAKPKGIPVTPFLSPDWRAKFKGNLYGEVRIRAPLPMTATTSPQIDGTLSLAQGEVEALPVLDEIATFTSTQRFRKINLTKMSAGFNSENGRTKVTNFIAESEGLIRVEGAFTVEQGLIEGDFQVGVTPAALQWLPSALQNRVFTASHDGYVWTPMHLSGPVGHPSEDLTKRLAGAMIDAGLDTATDVIKIIPGGDKLPDAPKQLINDVGGILSPLFGK